MGYGEKRGNYWRGRYKIETGKYGTVTDALGDTVRFNNKRDAKKAADEEEAKLRAGLVRAVLAGRVRFGDWASTWFARQDLAASTMQNYKRHIEEHLMPSFESMWLDEISKGDVVSWEKDERSRGYAESSIKTWRSTLHLVLEDAVEDEQIRLDINPAARRRGRGRRAGRSRSRGPEKTITDALGILLIAERAALLSGRDDEFVAVVTKGYTGIRWGELVGLETEYVRQNNIRVEWQLYELDTGELLRCPPKDDSHRTVDTPDWLSCLLSEHIARTQPKPCACHGRTYAFSGHRPANHSASTPGAKLIDVARRAGVSTGTVSNVLNRPETVPPVTRAKVEAAMADLGYMRGHTR